MAVRVNFVMTRGDCVECYILLFGEIILQQLGAFRAEVHGSLVGMCAFGASWGRHSGVVKLPVMPPGAEDMEYLRNP